MLIPHSLCVEFEKRVCHGVHTFGISQHEHCAALDVERAKDLVEEPRQVRLWPRHLGDRVLREDEVEGDELARARAADAP